MENLREQVLAGIKRSPPLEGTESAAGALARVRYTHDAMIDMVIADPSISQGAIARHFGFTQAWVSRVFCSDAFQARLAQRKSDLVDPTLALSVEERLRALTNKSLDILQEKLELPTATFDQALQAATLATKSLGYGARSNNVSVQQNFIVPMPQKVEKADDWAKKYSGPSPELQAMAAEVVEGEVISEGSGNGQG